MVSRAKPPWPAHPHPPKSHLADSIAKAKGGNGGGGNKSFMAQIIPVYGFGLLMYILYILFKISSTGSGQSHKTRTRCGGNRTGSGKCKITDYELAQLQAKLRETEVAMKQIASKMGHGSDKFPNDTSEQEANLLRQLKEITRVIKEQNIIEGIGPEKEPDESHYKEHSDGYGGETEHSRCRCRHDRNYSKSSQRSAEEPETKLDQCLFNETAENKIGQDEDSERGAQIGRCARGVGGDGEDLHQGLARDLAVTPQEDGTASGEDHCRVGDSRTELHISEPQHVTTYSTGALRKRNKMAIE
ncbi:protein RIC-3 [Amblyraja radiata]|uniref:protein RIC-3 n=1 Tax=Amblyraja radiata TaxID=386614 RepID=UPI0014022930|nr:protein RIC-3 [Amblyraja radiata]